MQMVRHSFLPTKILSSYHAPQTGYDQTAQLHRKAVEGLEGSVQVSAPGFKKKQSMNAVML